MPVADRVAPGEQIFPQHNESTVMGKCRGFENPQKLGKYWIRSNKAVMYKLHIKHSLKTLKLNYSVFIKKDKRFWNVTMHIKLVEHQISKTGWQTIFTMYLQHVQQT